MEALATSVRAGWKALGKHDMIALDGPMPSWVTLSVDDTQHDQCYTKAES